MITFRNSIIIFFLSIFICNIFASGEIDLSYSPLNNGGAEKGLQHWISTNVEQVRTESLEGEYCFKLSPGSHVASLTSEPVSVRAGEKLRLEYYLMADNKAFSNAHKASLLVRSYSSDKQIVLEKQRIDLEATGNKWQKIVHGINAAPNAYYVDVTFEYMNSDGSGRSLTPVFIDSISLFREIDYTPLYGDIKPLSSGDTLYVFNAGSRRDGNESIAMQTIQGVTARNSHVRVWIDTGDNTFPDLFSQK